MNGLERIDAVKQAKANLRGGRTAEQRRIAALEEIANTLEDIQRTLSWLPQRLETLFREHR